MDDLHPASLREADFILSSGQNKHEKFGVKLDAFHVVIGKHFTVLNESWFYVWTTVIISNKEVLLASRYNDISKKVPVNSAFRQHIWTWVNKHLG